MIIIPYKLANSHPVDKTTKLIQQIAPDQFNYRNSFAKVSVRKFVSFSTRTHTQHQTSVFKTPSQFIRFIIQFRWKHITQKRNFYQRRIARSTFHPQKFLKIQHLTRIYYHFIRCCLKFNWLFTDSYNVLIKQYEIFISTPYT